MDLLTELLKEEDYMQYQMNQKLGPNALNRQSQADRTKQQTQPAKAQQPTDMGAQNGMQGDVPGDNQGALQGGGDVQSANQAAKEAVKLLRQSAQALAPAKFEGDTSKAMEYVLGRIQDYFANKQI